MTRAIEPARPDVLPDTRRGHRRPRGPIAWWRSRRRRTKVILIGLPLLVVLGLVATAGVLYAVINLPPRNAAAIPQSIAIDYADGTLLAQTGQVDRTDVPLSAVPPKVREAVLAAEDREFYSEPGISLRGIVRAAWADISGGSIEQGGSTITQQYVKNVYLTSQRTFWRKIKEIVLAIKLSRRESKNEILDSYLNTIYFGRGAYGIAAAARRYFGIPVQRLSVGQGAVLAGLIRAPSVLDPRVDPQAARIRYAEVIGTMVTQHWLTPAQAAHTRMPRTITEAAAAPKPVSGPTYYVEQRVLAELAADGFSAARIRAGGFTVTTTLSRQDQAAAVAAVTGAPGGTVTGAPKTLREGLVAVQPGTGEIKAYYGGAHPGQTDEVDLGASPPGSTYKAIVLAAALQAGIPITRTYDGSSPQVFPGNPTPISNDGDEQYGYLDLATAIADSVNVVYVHLGLDVGEARVAAMAHRLGIPESSQIPLVEDQPLGQNPLVTPLTMAEVYGTFAGDGVRAQPYLVSKVTDAAGDVLYFHHPQRRRVLSANVADQVTQALEGVLQYGTAAATPLAGGRPAAGKTGTTQNNVSAWFVGYTPQLVTAVQLYDYGRVRGGNGFIPLLDIGGYSEVYGADIPAHVWQDFMDLALAGDPVVPFAGVTAPTLPVAPVTTPPPSVSASVPPSPSRSPTPTSSPTPTHSSSPSPTPSSGSPSPQPSGSHSP